MSETEKPLHVRVAEALGCNSRRFTADLYDCRCDDKRHAEHKINEDKCHSHSGLGCDDLVLARYDTDWSATGPLIERYHLRLLEELDTWHAHDRHEEESDHTCAIADTPLLAVCRLILALSKAGKLPKEQV